MRKWIAPLILGLLLAGGAFYIGVLAMPRVLMAMAVTRVANGAGGMNQMAFPPLATETSRAVVRPSPDLAYSICPFDVSGKPVLVTAAPVDTPYWSLAIFDAETNTVFTRNNRQTKGRPVRVVVAREGQATPPGVTVVRVQESRGIALVRSLVVDRAQFAPLDRARRRSDCAPVG